MFPLLLFDCMLELGSNSIAFLTQIVRRMPRGCATLANHSDLSFAKNVELGLMPLRPSSRAYEGQSNMRNLEIIGPAPLSASSALVIELDAALIATAS